MITHQLSDLLPPVDKKTGRQLLRKFAQTYTLTPQDAFNLRFNDITDIPREPKGNILRILDKIFRKNPYGETFIRTQQLIDEIKRQKGEVPNFRVFAFYFYFCIFYLFYLRFSS